MKRALGDIEVAGTVASKESFAWDNEQHRNNVLSFNSLTVRYSAQQSNALTNVSLAVGKGSITAVVGPNGSGKSSLVRALLRLVKPIEGLITVGGRDLRHISHRDFAREVAVVPQREEPSAPLLVRELVSLGRYSHMGVFSAPSALDDVTVSNAMQRAGVLELSDRRTDALSGGEWQRVRIARALAQGCSTLVLDEPTTFLDIRHEMAIFELIDSLAADGTAVMLISHQLNLVARFASHIVLLNKGEIAAAGSANDVMRGEVLEQVYQWPLVITRDPVVGAPALFPLRSGGLRHSPSKVNGVGVGEREVASDS